MAKFFSGEKIRNFWYSWFWQKIALLVGGAVLCFVLILILSAFFGKTKFWMWAAAVLFFGIIGFALAIIYQIVKVIKGKIQQMRALSPEELARIEEEKRRDEETAQAIRDTIKEWVYTPMECDLVLPKWEVCLSFFEVAVYKEKVATKRISFGGFRYRIKIAKGLSYNIGQITPFLKKEKIQYLDDYGVLYITNKRTIFKGKKKTDSIKIDKIIDLEMIPWGVLIYRDTGAVKAYNFFWDYKFFPVYMSALMNN